MTVLPRAVRTRMLLRSFSIQGSWNYETLIGSGFAFTLLPALRWIYGEGGELERALARHIELFNSHPYFATLAVGAVSQLEADGVDPSVVRRFKAALRGSLGTIGDRLFWSTWRPMSVLLGLLLLLAGAAWWVSVLTFLFVYNLMHLWIRGFGLWLGIRAGLDVGRLLRAAPLQWVIERASQLACLFVGCTTVLVVRSVLPDAPAVVATAGAIGIGFWLGVRTRLAMSVLLAGVVVLAILFGLVGYGA